MYQCGNYNGHLNVTSKKIKELRLKNKMSLSDLSTKLSLVGIDIPKTSLHKLENGNRIIKDYELYALAYIFNVPVEELLENFITEFNETNVN